MWQPVILQLMHQQKHLSQMLAILITLHRYGGPTPGLSVKPGNVKPLRCLLLAGVRLHVWLVQILRFRYGANENRLMTGRRLIYPLDAGIYPLSDWVGHFEQRDLLSSVLRELQRRRQGCPEPWRSSGRAVFSYNPYESFILSKESCLWKPVSLDVLFPGVLEERALPQTSSGWHPPCRNLSKESPVKALLKKGEHYLHKDGRGNCNNEWLLDGAGAEGKSEETYPAYYQHICSWCRGTEAAERALGMLERFGFLQAHINPSRSLHINRYPPRSDLRVWD